MQFEDKIIVITGGASGIGKALAIEAKSEGARAVVVVDLDKTGADEVASGIGGISYALDVSDEQAVATMIDHIETNVGPIDIYFSNAGVLFTDAPSFDCYAQSTDQWNKAWSINVLAHTHVARALFPLYKQRGCGGFIITASAAGLLSQIGDVLYSTTKHAAVGLAEAMAIAHGDDGITVAALCPQAVESKMTVGAEKSSAAMDGMLTGAEMAKRSFKQLKEGRFMVRPHEQVEDYFKHKAENYDRWVGGMRKMRRMQIKENGTPM